MNVSQFLNSLIKNYRLQKKKLVMRYDLAGDSGMETRIGSVRFEENDKMIKTPSKERHGKKNRETSHRIQNIELYLYNE